MESQFANHGRTAADKVLISHRANRPETRIADNWALEPGSLLQHRKAVEVHRSTLRSCWWLERSSRGQLETSRVARGSIGRLPAGQSAIPSAVVHIRGFLVGRESRQSFQHRS